MRALLLPLACAWAVGCAGPDPTDRPPAPTAAGSAPAESVPAAGAPAQLEVVESGFTAFSTDGNDFASFAVILHNPNEAWTAFRMEVLIDFLDDDGAFVAGDEVAVVLLPGQTSAMAGEVFGAGRATRLEVRLPDDTTAFVAAEATDETFDVLDVETAMGDGLNVTSGRLVSRFDRPHRLVQLAAVYRDASDSIVGGALGGVETIPAGGEVAFEIIDSAPFGDLAATEVHWQLSGVTR